jgi:hypothetical protein
MTGTTDPGQIDLREQIARIDRMRDESDKFRAEQRKLISEAAKFDRDRRLAPLLAVVTMVAAITAAAAAVTAATAAIINLLK